MPKTPEPFAHPRYEDNAERCQDGEPCAICGKEVKDAEEARYIRVVDAGRRFARADEVVEDESGDMGAYPVGPSCYRKYRAFFRSLEK